MAAPATGRRTKSPVPRGPRQPILDVSVRLAEGREAEFLDEVAGYVATFRAFELSADVVGDLITCAVDPNLDAAADLLLELTKEMPTAFGGSEERLFEVFWGTPRRRVCFELRNCVDPNYLLGIAISKEVSLDLVDFVAGLCCGSKTDLSEQETCDRVLGMALAVREREMSSARIIRAVARAHPECLEGVDDPLVQEVGGQRCPAFDPANVAGWCGELRGFVVSCEDWNSVRDSVYRDCEFAVGQTSEKEAVFAVLREILELKGIAMYEPVLRIVVPFLRERKYESVGKVTDFLVEAVDAEDLVAECFRVADDAAPELARNAIDIATKAVQNVNDPDGFQKHLAVTTGFLNRMLACESIDVRKAVVFCYVALYDVFGSVIDPYSEELTPAQKKLIACYRGTDVL
jgi:hypothetical protein